MSDSDDESTSTVSSLTMLENLRIEFFKDTLRKNGVSLSRNSDLHVVTKEQSLVVRDLEKSLNGNVVENVSKFIQGFKTCCKKEGFLSLSLQPTVLRKNAVEDEDNHCGSNMIHQESLVRIFLQVSCLQKEMVKFILDTATEKLDEAEGDLNFQNILNSMKYLPFIQSADVVTQKLLDMIEIGSFGAQLEILNSIPEIIPDAQYESTAKKLSKILESNNELTSAIIDCLNSLNLSGETRLEIQQYIVQHLLSSVSVDVYPVLFDFLTSECKPINLPAILLKCRDVLNDIMRNETTDKEKESRKVVVMNKLQISSVSKVQYDGWMNLLINITNFKTQHKPFDIIIMAMLHSIGNSRKRSIQILFKNHVKREKLKKQHLDTLFEHYYVKQIFDDYFTSLIEIASNLLKHPTEQLSTEFGSAIFVLLFSNRKTSHVQRQDLLHTLILLTSGWETKNIGAILKILLELSKGRFLKLHVAQLMGLLEKIDTFELNDVKQVFELLCFLLCNKEDESNSGLKDELHMLIRKQMSSAKRHLKQRGIIAAIIMAKHIAATSGTSNRQDDSEEFEMDISNLPEGSPQESASLLELARNAASTLPELMGMYYDQLASMLVRAPNLDKHFLKWLKDSVQAEFEEIYTIKDAPENINEVSIYVQYCLNEDDELEDSLNINIAPLAMRPTHNNPIALLAPLFRMFRMLCDVNEIDALLGCGVVLPELEDIASYDSLQCKQVADSLFHCINWFRELVNAFCRHSNKKLRLRLINRVLDLVKLEEIFCKNLKHVENYKIPPSYFYNISIAPGKGSPTKTATEKIIRPKKLKTNLGETVDFLNETTASTTTQEPRRKKAKTKRSPLQKIEFRELDTDLIILLKYPLDISTNNDQSSPHTTISVGVFHYVITDVVNKLDSIINDKNIGMSNLNDLNTRKWITDCVNFVPKIYANFKTVSKEIQELQNKIEAADHVDFFTADANILKELFRLCLEYFVLIFSWKEYAKNMGLFRDCLRSFTEDETASQSIINYSRTVCGQLLNCADQCLQLRSAVCLVKALDALCRRNCDNTDIKKTITAVSGKFLNRQWYNSEGDLDRGKVANENLDVLIKSYLDGANIKTIAGIVGTLQKQTILQKEDDHLEMLESIGRGNFFIFYKNLCHYTVERMKIEMTSLTNKEHLNLWKTVTIAMQGLMNIAKTQNYVKMKLHIVFLQKSIAILKIFLSDGMAILEIMLKSKVDEVVEILKTLQTTTRFLHNLCCTSKLSKETSIIAYIPKFKETIEMLIYRVKAALVANKCSEAFWMGNLKNKDLKGEVILTQTCSSIDTDTEINEENDLPLEDSDNDMTEVEDEIQRMEEERSASEIYD